MPWMPIDADGEGRLTKTGVEIPLRAKLESLAGIRIKGDAEVPPTDSGQEIDAFRIGELRGNDEVAFVLAVFVINQNDDLAIAKVFQNFGYLGKEHPGMLHAQRFTLPQLE